MAQPTIYTAMASMGVERIMTQPFDSHRFLIEAMDAEQLDLAFCSVIDFAYQRGSYMPVFQLRRPGDPHSSTADRRVWHSGVIFVGRQSELFDMNSTETLDHLPNYVMNHELAMVGSSSAAGYVYPYLALDRLTTAVPLINAPSIFWESSSEVIKAVINGIHEIGACDASAIDEVLKAHGLLDKKHLLIKEVLRTDPVPRDPIVLHNRWLNTAESDPRASSLGREITRGIAAFFRSNPALPRLERTSEEPFDEVAENLQRFRQKRGQADEGIRDPQMR